MHLPLIKSLAAIISASVLAVGVALAPAGDDHHMHGAAENSQTSTLQTDGLRFLGQLAAGNIGPDPALKQSWIDDITAVAHSLRLSGLALRQQLERGHSLAQIAASRGVPASVPADALLHRFRDDLNRAERDQAISPAAVSALINAVSTALGNS